MLTEGKRDEIGARLSNILLTNPCCLARKARFSRASAQTAIKFLKLRPHRTNDAP
jgi:hypothetical protein